MRSNGHQKTVSVLWPVWKPPQVCNKYCSGMGASQDRWMVDGVDGFFPICKNVFLQFPIQTKTFEQKAQVFANKTGFWNNIYL